MLTVVVKGTIDQAQETIEKAHNYAEAFEFRLDLMKNNDLETLERLLHIARVPVIFTLRRKDQGGAFEGEEAERKNLLLDRLKLRPSYVDLEYDVSFAHQVPSEVKIISSCHNFKETPENLSDMLRKVQRLPAHIFKIVCWAHSSIDALRVLVFTKSHQNLAGMCMGDYGALTRILSPVIGSALTYAPLVEEEGTASGQVSLSKLVHTYHFFHLTSQTKIYALIGQPVDKSIGHECHNQVFRKLQENAVYVKIPLSPHELPSFFYWIKKLPFEGFSVTMPLKEKLGSFIERVSPQTEKIGALNTLTSLQGEWCGYNTDGEGALDALEKKGAVVGKTLLILGAGGTAKAIAFEGTQRGAHILVANRTYKKAQHVAKQVGGEGYSLEDVKTLKYDVLINTTSLGMAPEIKQTPIDPEWVIPNTTVFDVILSPKETTLIQAAKNKGCDIVYGYEMYAKQAARQLELWLKKDLEYSAILKVVKACVVS